MALRVVWPREAMREGKGELERLVVLAGVTVIIVCVSSVDFNSFHLRHRLDSAQLL